MPLPPNLPLGVTTVMLHELDLPEQLALCAELGVTHYVARPRIIPDKARDQPFSSHGNHRYDLTPQRLLDEAAAIHQAILDAGLIPFGTVPAQTCDAPDDALELNFKGAAAAGFTNMRVTPIAYPRNELFDYADYLERSVARYREVCAMGKAHGVKPVIEMHRGNSVAAPGLAYNLVKEFEPNELGLIIDLPNFAGEGFVQPELSLSTVEPWIDHAHVGGLKMVKGDRDELGFVRTWGEMCSLMDSDLDIPKWIGLLHALGRPCPLVIEDYSKGMSGEQKLRRAVNELTPLLESLA